MSLCQKGLTLYESSRVDPLLVRHVWQHQKGFFFCSLKQLFCAYLHGLGVIIHSFINSFVVGHPVCCELRISFQALIVLPLQGHLFIKWSSLQSVSPHLPFAGSASHLDSIQSSYLDLKQQQTQTPEVFYCYFGYFCADLSLSLQASVFFLNSRCNSPLIS